MPKASVPAWPSAFIVTGSDRSFAGLGVSSAGLGSAGVGSGLGSTTSGFPFSGSGNFSGCGGGGGGGGGCNTSMGVEGASRFVLAVPASRYHTTATAISATTAPIA